MIALLCPYCAGSDGGGAGTALLLGAMILLPFGITWVVTRAISRIERGNIERGNESPRPVERSSPGPHLPLVD
jgi:hypothetical protein